MQILTEEADIFNGASEGQTLTMPSLVNYARTSVTTSQNLRRHTLSTKNHALYIAFYEQVINLDDPDIAGVGGTFSIQFYADDAECEAVIQAALRSAR